MKIGIYFDSRHIGKWDWQEFLTGKIGVSGTDSQTLFLAYYLTQKNCQIYFFSQTPPPLELNNFISINSNDLNDCLNQAKSNKIDVLIFCSSIGKEQIIKGIQLLEKIEQKCIFWCHNDPDPKITKMLFESQFISRVICVSATQADGFRDKPIFNKIEYIYNSIDPKLYNFQNSIKKQPYQVLYLGSLSQTKGFQHLAKAWQEVKNKIPSVTLLVLGSGKLYNREAKLGILGVADDDFEKTAIIPYLGTTKEEITAKGVTFLGLVSPQQAREIISNSTLGVCNPNCSGSLETFCVSAIEIQAGGCAVISANRGGLKETVINKKTGILINNEKQLSQAIISLLNNPNKVKLMGENGKIFVTEKFNYELIINQWFLLLESVINQDKTKLVKFSLRRANFKILIKEFLRLIRLFKQEI